ncbi:hypothetical protein DL771_012335 [Monosporascus sp. 5C6A]|nr:hypothetical protein DL771_012335 [Monosporascus sp. 5C6A]
MSFPHNTAAPGFGQAHDPFAALAEHDNDMDALDFDDTYDGLGDQLDETDDAFNDDTFGGDDGPSNNSVGKDFDFFGQTAKVAGAIEEEHLRFNRRQPAPKPTTAAPSQNYNTGYSYQQAPKPVRSGYEKYKEPEPVSDLQVDASIWGVAPKKSSTPAAAVQQQPPAPATTGRKMMSLEEVEAAMRARPKPAAPAQPQQQPSFSMPEPVPLQQPVQPPRPEGTDYRQHQQDYRQSAGFQGNDSHRLAQGGPHGHPVTILRRPSRDTPPAGPAVAGPVAQQQQAPPVVGPTQILQNPNRLSGDAARVGVQAHPVHRSQDSFSRQAQMLNQPPQLPQLSEEDKAAYLEAEARRAKRNHKIFVLSKDNGLMTPQDKSFITRIQLQQLVAAIGDPNEHDTDAALAEDFYYQVLSSLRAQQRPHPNQPLNNFAQTYLFQTGSRHAGMRRHGRGPENHMQRMEQQVQRAVEAAKNKPKNKQLVIEGSLGKISFSNTKTPKPLLNIKRTESGTDTNRPNSAHRPQVATNDLDRKVTLKDIENVYSALMKMEDLTRTMPPPPPPNGNPSEEFIERQAELQVLNERLWNALKVHEPIGATAVHPFIAFISYPKGMKAIPRIFRFLNHEQRTTILTLIVIHLDQLEIVRDAQVQPGEPVTLRAAIRESIELFTMAVTPSLFQVLNDSELPIVTAVLGLMVQNLNVDKVARTRVGTHMFTMVLSRAELIKQTLASNDPNWQQWTATFNHFFNALAPSLPSIFPGTVTSGEDIYVWQFLAAIGIHASPDEQQRLVLAVKDRVMDTVGIAKTLPADMAKERLDSVNLFMRSIGLDVELLK